MQKNQQPIEKKSASNGYTLDVHSVFFTIQGEGPFSGSAAVFIRLAGCNLQCPLCDTDYTEGRQALNIADVLEAVRASAPEGYGGLVVITGGEPFRQELAPLLSLLCAAGYYVQIESNGTLPPPMLGTSATTYAYFEKDIAKRHGVYLVCSPKTGKVHPMIHKHACCYKYVVIHEEVSPEDGLPLRALGHTANPHVARPLGPKRPIYVQPADEKNALRNRLNQKTAIKSCMDHGYTLQLQIHKDLGLE